MSKTNYLLEKFTTTGSIAGFDKITIAGDELSGKSPSNFTIAELLLALKRITEKFSPEEMYRLNILMEEHLQDLSNVHKVRFDQLGIDTENELYKRWQESNPDGDLDTFKSILYDYIQVATSEEVRTGTSKKMVSAADAVAILREHNDDPISHKAIIDYRMPGEPIPSKPTLSIKPRYLHLNNKQYPTEFMVINESGYLVKAADTPVDYLYGKPAVPFFKPITNYVFPSIPDGTGCNGLVSTLVPNIISPRKQSSLLLRESTVNELHYYNLNEIDVIRDREYTLSAFLFPVDGKTAALKIPELDVFGKYDLSTLTWTATENTKGQVLRLPNGWYVISLQFIATETTTIIPEIHSIASIELDILPYEGTNRNLFALSEIQFDENNGIAPRVLTIDSPESISGGSFSVTIPIEKFNPQNGLVKMSYVHQDTLIAGKTEYLYEFGDNDLASSKSIIRFSKNQTHYIHETVNSVGDTISKIQLPIPLSRTYVKEHMAFGFDGVKHIFGTTGLRPINMDLQSVNPDNTITSTSTVEVEYDATEITPANTIAILSSDLYEDFQKEHDEYRGVIANLTDDYRRICADIVDLNIGKTVDGFVSSGYLFDFLYYDYTNDIEYIHFLLDEVI